MEPIQLIPGCVLLNDVKGKSNRAIIPKKTVLTAEHITILDKFLITSVDVESKFSDGTMFVPKVVRKKTDLKKQLNQLTFAEHYQYVVHQYKKLFTSWQNNIQVDMPTVRKLAIPLFERVDQGDVDILMLRQYNTKKDYLYHHSVAVSVLVVYVSKKMGYAFGDCIQIGLAGFLSDCGMAKLSPTILHKSGELSPSENDEFNMHPTYSYRMVEHIATITQIVKLAILQHHERMDGSGYPLGVKKDKIHAYARIIAVSDRYLDMLCQLKQSPFQVIEELIHTKYTLFDYQVIETFSKKLVSLSIGTSVSLSDGNTGEIVFIEDNNPTRPMVKVHQTGEILTLKNNTSIYINEVMET